MHAFTEIVTEKVFSKKGKLHYDWECACHLWAYYILLIYVTPHVKSCNFLSFSMEIQSCACLLCMLSWEVWRYTVISSSKLTNKFSWWLLEKWGGGERTLRFKVKHIICPYYGSCKIVFLTHVWLALTNLICGTYHLNVQNSPTIILQYLLSRRWFLELTKMVNFV